MDNKSTTKRMIGAVVLVLVAALLLAWLLKGKNADRKEGAMITSQAQESGPIQGFPSVNDEGVVAKPDLMGGATDAQQQAQSALDGAGDVAANAGKDAAAAGGSMLGSVVNSAGNAVDSGQQAVKDAASGFAVRPGAEQRQVVDGETVKAGMGSMGTGSVAEKAPAASNAAGSGVAVSSSSSASSDKDRADTRQTDVSTEKKVPQAKLVGEKAVPSPTTEAKRRAAAEAKKKAAAKEAASKKAAASAAAAGGKGFVVQVLASGSESKANGLRDDLAKDGYAVFVTKAVVSGKTVYRVRVGAYPTKEAAVAVQTRMKARYTKNPFVKNSFVTRN